MAESNEGGVLSFADLTNECQDIGAERMFIPWRGLPTQEHKPEHKNTTA